MHRETYRQGIRQKQQKFFNKKIKPAQKCRLHWKLQNAAKMKVDLFPWQHFSGRLLSAGERTKCTQFPSLGHRCIQPAPSFSAPSTNNIVSVSMIISLLYITISYIRQPPTNNIVSVVDINICYNITIATSTLLYDVQYDGEVMKMSDVFKG